MAKIRVLGSGREVGRAAIFVENGGRGILLDYGVSFDENDVPIFPEHVRPRNLEGIVLTHSHLDHIGAAPSLYVSVRPRILATRVTLEVSRLLLYDMIKLNGIHLPYDEASVDEMVSHAEQARYREEYELGSFTVTLLPSGHIPGSASVLVEDGEGRRLLYTSDINNIETNLTGPLDYGGAKPEVLIVESTYATTNHPPRRDTEERFYRSVREVVESGGTVLVPAFSVSRGQEIACVLASRGFEYPVWIDGMIRQVAEVYIANRGSINKPEALEKALSEFNIVRGWQDRRRAYKEPGVILASAGMLKGGPSLYYLKKMATNPSNAVFMVSFQAPGTPGREILETGTFGEPKIPVKARIEWFDFSSHIDGNGIMGLVKSMKTLEKVVLVHGVPEAQEKLAERIREETGIEAVYPETGSIVEA